jgi:toxin ParE1/3/4
MIRVRFSALALNDLEEIAAYIEHESQSAAQRDLNAIEGACFSLREFPELGMKSEIPPARRLFVPGFPYQIVYEISQSRKEAVILRAYHNARESEY